MIIFFEAGRLGNQLFQYCALTAHGSDRLILMIGMRELRSSFTGAHLGTRSFSRKLAEWAMSKVGQRCIDMLARRLRLITLVEEDRANGSAFRSTRGAIDGIKYFARAYYQNENVVETAHTDIPRFSETVRQHAEAEIARLGIDVTNAFFIHVRRGDYVHWPSSSEPAVMPWRWYRRAMEELSASHPHSHFVAFSDDLPYIKDVLPVGHDVTLVDASPEVSLAIMSSCALGGVLSASSFAWWGAYFCRSRHPGARFIAPMFWTGHARGEWYPPGVQTSWIRYLDDDSRQSNEPAKADASNITVQHSSTEPQR